MHRLVRLDRNLFSSSRSHPSVGSFLRVLLFLLLLLLFLSLLLSPRALSLLLRSSGLNKRWIQLNRRSRSSSGSHTESVCIARGRLSETGLSLADGSFPITRDYRSFARLLKKRSARTTRRRIGRNLADDN